MMSGTPHSRKDQALLDNTTSFLKSSSEEEVIQMAVRMMLTRGQTRAQLARDLGIGQSTLNRWLRETFVGSPYGDVMESLFEEVCSLRQENALLRKVVSGRKGTA